MSYLPPVEFSPLLERVLELLRLRGGWPANDVVTRAPALPPDAGGGPMLGAPDVRPPVPGPATPIHTWAPDATGGPVVPGPQPWQAAQVPSSRGNPRYAGGQMRSNEALIGRIAQLLGR